MSFSSGNKPTGILTTTSNDNVSGKTMDASNTVNGAPINNSTITGASIESPIRSDVKTVDDISAAETYAATAANGQLIFTTTEKKMFQIVDNALAEVGGGSASINYIENSDFEVNLSGYNKYKDAAADVAVDGTGGAAAVIDFVEEVAVGVPLRGSRSGKISKTTTSSSQGEGVSVDFTVDVHDQAQMMTIQFDYDASAAGYDDGDLRIYVYDVTNAKLIRVNGEDLKAGKGTHIAQFQTAADSTSYRLILHSTDTTTATYDVLIDNVQVGPRSVVKGVAATDWVAYPLEIVDSNGTDVMSPSPITALAYWRRVGDSIQIKGAYYHQTTVGTAGVSHYVIKFPDGLEVDVDKMFNGAGNRGAVDGLAHGDLGGGSHQQMSVTAATGNLNGVRIQDDSTGTLFGPSYFSMSTTFMAIAWEATVPIKGWSSNAILSEDIGNREIATRLSKGSGQSSPNGADTKVTFSSSDVEWDTALAFDDTNDRVQILETGFYDISGYVGWINDPGGIRDVYFKVNGLELVGSYHRQLSSSNGEAMPTSIVGTRLNKGDYVELWVKQNGGLNLGITKATFNVIKRPNPQTILDTATVAMTYRDSSGVGINTTAGGDLYTYNTKEFDTHNAYSGGVYTVPVSGVYSINAQFTVSNANLHLYQIFVYKNNGVYAHNTATRQATNFAPESPEISILAEVSKGDTIDIRIRSNIAGNNVDNDLAGNFISIHKIK